MNDKPDIGRMLAAPFPAEDVHWKPQAISGARALAVAYINARSVMDRLDDVLGVAGWQDHYTALPDGSAQCRLRCKIGGAWIIKADVGGPSEQPDEGDRRKAAFSDALKRAAVKYGIGRYLYRLPKQWADYDSKAKQFTRPPSLPAWALPRPVARVTIEQAKEVQSALQAGRLDHTKLFEHFKIAKLTELAADQHAAALAFCRDNTVNGHTANGRK